MSGLSGTYKTDPVVSRFSLCFLSPSLFCTPLSLLVLSSLLSCSPSLYSSLLHMPYNAQATPLNSAYDTQSPVARPRIEPPCVSFSPYYSPVRVRPLYARRPSAYRRHAPLHVSPHSYDDLMKTLDLRHVDFASIQRSSFDLSDILEESDVEIEISDILPSSPVSTHSTSTTLSMSYIRRRAIKSVALATAHIAAFVDRLRTKYQRAGPSPVVNDGTNSGLDLLA